MWYYRYELKLRRLNCAANSGTYDVFSYLHFRINI